MTQPFGFVPPVAIPVIGGAANAIIPTGGILGGAAVGARAGAVLGPKGVLAGALVGGLLGGLLLPSPLAPGTLPDGLDPGLEPAPIPDIGPVYPEGKWPGGDPSEGAPSVYFNGRYRKIRTGVFNYDCRNPERPPYENPTSESSPSTWAFRGRAVEIEQKAFKSGVLCDPAGYFDDFVIKIVGTEMDGSKTTIKQESVRNGTWYNGIGTVGEVGTTYVEIDLFNADGQPIDVGQQQPTDPARDPKPRPVPLPIEPLTPDPQAPPLPGPVPLPEPQPQPQPLEVPNPGNPEAPPITIPQTPPAVPQTPDPTKPGTDPIPQPTRPVTPTIPTPIPGVPTIPEPSPDPNQVPAPGPVPLPVPGPAPVPETDPQPGETPLPGTPITPTPTIPGVSAPPDTTQPTSPDGSVVPVPTPPTTPTPPGTHFPVPGSPGVTPGGTRADVSAIAAEIGRIEQKVARLQNGQGFPDLSDLLFLLPLLLEFLEGDIPGTTYELQGICEDVQNEGPQPTAQFEVASAKNLGAVINRLDTIDQMLQQHLAWKTPTCSRRPVLAGDWRTITFISDENSGTRGDRLRKRFRYRSLSGLGLPGVIDHWANFTWQAGAVCVQHAGSTWGTPQVWAASIDEGKRVIRHAAGEAGIDPDQNGRWVISGSNSARVGLPGTMRVNRKGGYYWITARDGPDGPPIVGTTP